MLLCSSLSQKVEFYHYSSTDKLKEFVSFNPEGEEFGIQREYYDIPPFNRYTERFFMDNRLLEEVEFVSSEFENKQKCSRYYSNGKKESVGHFLDGQMNGNWSFYDFDGSLLRKEKYSKGELKKVTAPRHRVPVDFN